MVGRKLLPDPGHQLGEGPGPGFGVVLTGEQMGQFVAEGGQTQARGIKDNNPFPVIGLGHEDPFDLQEVKGPGRGWRVTQDQVRRRAITGLAEAPVPPGDVLK